MTKVYVKRMGNNEVVKEIEVRYAYDSSNYDRFLSGLLRNMDIDTYYVDDSEMEKAAAHAALKAGIEKGERHVRSNHRSNSQRSRRHDHQEPALLRVRVSLRTESAERRQHL